MQGAIELLNKRVAESRQACTIAAHLDLLLNVFVPCCFSIGWSVRRCYWEGRQRHTGAWAADCLRQCMLLLCALLGDSARTSEYVRSIGVALLSWTSWHDEVPAAAYVEESCEAQLAALSSSLKRNPHATGIGSVCDMFILLEGASGEEHAAHHHPVSSGLQKTVFTNVTNFTTRGPRVMSYVPWRNAKTCTARNTWPDDVHIPKCPWNVRTDDVEASLYATLMRVVQGQPVHADVSDMCNDFLHLRSPADEREFILAVARMNEVTSTVQMPRLPKRLLRELELYDHNDPPRRRRRVTNVVHSSTSVMRRGAHLLQPSDPEGYTGPRFVGIPND